jgi:predicted SprT family Zn-dependent metalloprotease
MTGTQPRPDQPRPDQARPDQPRPDQTCDRCGPAVRAVYRVQRHGELYLCKHCANRLWPDLSRQGWNIWPVGEPACTTASPG